jgi:hypothetical protein
MKRIFIRVDPYGTPNLWRQIPGRSVRTTTFKMAAMQEAQRS